ncbi:hypothetical protein ANN_04400 [Periplaneta americana]|uniref:Transposase Tc1-like domain-containing protein n=1 Tax=Periplaneta americana TaxID=6978 RepID=A0ABQ8TA99_PERAM|nr:hypothetical protein ANN_04400 [Periplaneta americana]
MTAGNGRQHSLKWVTGKQFMATCTLVREEAYLPAATNARWYCKRLADYINIVNVTCVRIIHLQYDYLVLTVTDNVRLGQASPLSYAKGCSGQSLRQVAREFEVSPSVVTRLLNRHRETGQYCRRPGQGRKCKTSPQNDRYIALPALRQRKKTARDLQNDLYMTYGIRVSDQTVRNRLRKENIRPKNSVKKQRLTNEHKAARLKFAENHADWNMNQWEYVLF